MTKTQQLQHILKMTKTPQLQVQPHPMVNVAEGRKNGKMEEWKQETRRIECRTMEESNGMPALSHGATERQLPAVGKKVTLLIGIHTIYG